VNNNRQAFYLSHGGGPLPLLGDAAHEEMVQCLKTIPEKINKPSAIIVVSAHWEETCITITSGENPSLIYDYGGFPEESYKITYPCKGQAKLAGKIATLLATAGIEHKLDGSRGFDHGLFVPLKLMYPQADIPCVQISLSKSLDAAEHINLGRALQKLHDPSLLVIGSGFSFHNMQEFYSPQTTDTKAKNESFEAWLLETCGSLELGEQDRKDRLVNWVSAPSARYCHPREEHLLPLHVCYGYAEAACTLSFELQIMNKKSSMYLWQVEN
tara:strand:- start:2869 stop:3678 length:810 start_codon:yes stop_codon:yes gene_type:complete